MQKLEKERLEHFADPPPLANEYPSKAIKNPYSLTTTIGEKYYPVTTPKLPPKLPPNYPQTTPQVLNWTPQVCTETS